MLSALLIGFIGGTIIAVVLFFVLGNLDIPYIENDKELTTEELISIITLSNYDNFWK